MADAADDLVRSAAMAKVRYLRELHGGRIPRTALMEGITLEGTRIPISTTRRASSSRLSWGQFADGYCTTGVRNASRSPAVAPAAVPPPGAHGVSRAMCH